VVQAMASRWWVFLAQGVVMIILAALAIVQPSTIITFLGAYAVIDGLLKLFSAFGDQPDDQSRWPALISGALSVIAGLIFLIRPLFAAGVLTYIIALWAIIVGALVLIWAFRLRQEIQDEWLLVIFGVISILFGVLALANLSEGALVLRNIFVAFMLVGGVLAIALSFRIRSIAERLLAMR
jgi:uncharacterized membrane protein HdeD (DUF308 family)